MMVRAARVVAFAVVPAELVLAVLLVAGVSPPLPVLVAAEVAVAAVLALEAVAFWRLFREERRTGAGRRAAAVSTVRRLVPEPVRRLMGVEMKGTASLIMWVLRRRHGVPPGATAVSYHREQTPMMVVLLGLMVVETVALDLILRGVGAPDGLRLVVLVIDIYGVVLGLAVHAACVTRPHVVSDTELRIRYGAFFDLRVPRDLITSVRRVRNLNESGMVRAADGRLAVAVSSQTNLLVELARPIIATMPLGRRVEVTAVRFFADSPSVVLPVLRPAERHGTAGKRQV